MIITVSTDGRASEENEIATLKRYGVDGFFYSKMSNRIASVPASLGDYPVVMVDATDADNQIPSIEPDEFQIAYDATKRLIQADCKRIAYRMLGKHDCAGWPFCRVSGGIAGFRFRL